MRPENGTYNFNIYDLSGTHMATLVIASLDTPGILRFELDADSAELLQFLGVPTASVPPEKVKYLLESCEIRR